MSACLVFHKYLSTAQTIPGKSGEHRSEYQQDHIFTVTLPQPKQSKRQCHSWIIFNGNGIQSIEDHTPQEQEL
ncbi:hypothetical protein FKM82_006542 [Ascaphus truei]